MAHLGGIIPSIGNVEQGDALALRAQNLSEGVMQILFRELTLGILDQDKELFSVLLCSSLQRHARQVMEWKMESLGSPNKMKESVKDERKASAVSNSSIPSAGGYAPSSNYSDPVWYSETMTESDWSLFLAPPPLDEEDIPLFNLNPDENWISDANWAGICGAEAAFPQLEGVTQLIHERPSEWKAFIASNDVVWQLTTGLKGDENQSRGSAEASGGGGGGGSEVINATLIVLPPP